MGRLQTPGLDLGHYHTYQQRILALTYQLEMRTEHMLDVAPHPVAVTLQIQFSLAQDVSTQHMLMIPH